MTITVFIFLFFPILICGISVLFFKINNKILKLLLAFSGAFLLSLSFNEILPEIYSSKNHNIVGYFVLIGFFIQLVLDFLTKGVEHGHEHNCDETPKIAFIPVLIGVCIHSFIEAMPLSNCFNAPLLSKQLLTGIVIHNIPISIVLMSLILQSGKSVRISVLLLIIFALSAPLGTLTSTIIGTNFIINITDFIDITMGIVVGIFLHISTIILFESDQNHKFNLYKFVFILLGIAISFIHF